MSQNVRDNFFPPSPEASSLIKYVDVPVNYSTGVTNYSIPIHNIKLKNLNIPITLSYQSSGLKPSEIAGNTGYGWELNAGGKITQNVIGQNDIDKQSPAHPYWNLPTNRDFKLPLPVYDLAWGKNPYSPSQLDSIHRGETDYTMFYNINALELDTKPDMFYYSTPVKSGKFFFGNNFETKQIPFGKENILFNINNLTFEITDTDGVKYIYGIVTENLNFTQSVCPTIPKLNGISNSNSYTYYLTQIRTPNNEVVDFIYDTVKYNLVNDKDYTRYYQWFYGGAEKVTSYSSEITAKVLTKIKVNQDYEVDFVYSKYRKDIKGKTQQYAPKTLDAIKVKYRNEIEAYHFDYGYFGVNAGEYNPGVFEGAISNEDSAYMLKLKSFQKAGENPYVFSYYDETSVAKYSSCLDHWGYFSASCGRYTVNTLFNDLGNNKMPSLQASRTNILKNVVLPTKGEVEFNYELNSCSENSISYTTYEWSGDGSSVYANDEVKFDGEWITKFTVFEVPERSITIPYVSFNLDSPGPDTTSNFAIATLYDDKGNDMGCRFIDNGTGRNFKPFDGCPLLPGKKYKLVLQFYRTMENEGKYVGIYFLMSKTTNQVDNPTVGGLRIQNIITKDENNLASKRSFEYMEDDGKSSGKLYEIPRYYDEYSYFEEMKNEDDNIYKSGWQTFAVQHSRIPSDLFGFNGHHIFYSKVTEKSMDVKNESNSIKIEKYFTFYDDKKYGDQSYFSGISYNWKRGLPSQINEFNGNDIVRKTIFSYKFLDTPSSDLGTSRYEAGFPLVNAVFPNEFHKRSLDVSVLRYSPSFYNLYAYSNFKLISAWYYMDKKITEEYLDGKILKTEEEFKYDNPVSAQLTSQINKNSNGEILETKYYYPDDLLNEPFMSELKATNRISTPIITEQYKDGVLLSKSRTVFERSVTTANLLQSKEVYSAKFPNNFANISNIGNLEKKITYNQYDDKGNVLQYTTESGVPVSIIWGYNKTQPIAKIENATYAEVEALPGFGASFTILENFSGSQESILRNNLSEAMVTTYTYSPLVGVASKTDPKGIVTYYEYDSLGRLQYVKDHNLYVLQRYCYNYKGQIADCGNMSTSTPVSYKSTALSKQFTRDNCASGGIPQSVWYTMSEGAYTSSISQTAADTEALKQFNAKGQAFANDDKNAKCIFKSAAIASQNFQKTNCTVGGEGSYVAHSLDYNAVSSEISQADADNRAWERFQNEGKANANTYGYCTFRSIAMSGTFQKSGCTGGAIGSYESYVLPEGEITLRTSQEHVNSEAAKILKIKGQDYANAKGQCVFYSASTSRVIRRTYCPRGLNGTTVTYTVPAGTYKSIISQAHANQQAEEEIDIKGQGYADQKGECNEGDIPLE
ncbi:DUF5977 domain-containing protein [Flavobacterium sp.]|uniref:DUF5977 domain-containing protein n=1 Tax=Flavobacterium sp. TaxID=239 RepID=UPI0025B98B1E|nr:DUF5977 domain-containing protein [Flavobacterium sp.]